MNWKFWSSTETVSLPEAKTVAMTAGQQSPSPQDSDIYKAYIPEFLYKPYFGYPRAVNVLSLRKLAKNPYVFSVIKAIYDEAANIDFDLKEKEGVEIPKEIEESKKWFLKWLNDPNGNNESFGHILKAIIKDMCELDSGVWVKVFNQVGQLTQMFARDGGTFLMNPNYFGYIGDRADFVKPVSTIPLHITNHNPQKELIKAYELSYDHIAAYYQYGYTHAALPVPFGKREIIYMMANPRTDSIYGRSPMEILADTIMTLVDGQLYGLDFYINRDVPNGILSLEGLDETEAQNATQRMQKRFQSEDQFGLNRNIRGKIPTTGYPINFVDFNLKPADLELIAQQQWFTKILWMCFGVNSNEMGVTDDVNKASSEQQTSINKKKALLPILKIINYKIQHELMNEEIVYYEGLDEESKPIPHIIPPLQEFYDFEFDDYDLDEDLKRHTLMELQIRMGIATPEMIAEEEGIDVKKLEGFKEDARKKEIDTFQQQSNSFGDNNAKNNNNKGEQPKVPAKKDSKQVEGKAKNPFQPIKDHIKETAKDLKNLLDDEYGVS